MTVWTLHILNARLGLTPVLSEIRAALRDAVAQTAAVVDLPQFDLVVRPSSGATPAEAGAEGPPHAPGVIELSVCPDRFDPDMLRRAFVHQAHHLIRAEGPGYGRSLGEALVSEGLAAHFVGRVLGGAPDPRGAGALSPGLARRAMNEWSRLGYDHGEWFLGRARIRKGAGFALGRRLVADHLAEGGGRTDAAALARARADDFRAAMRALAKADAEGPDTAEAAAPETPQPPAG